MVEDARLRQVLKNHGLRADEGAVARLRIEFEVAEELLAEPKTQRPLCPNARPRHLGTQLTASLRWRVTTTSLRWKS